MTLRLGTVGGVILGGVRGRGSEVERGEETRGNPKATRSRKNEGGKMN